ncbi:glycosyltransferase family 2 protein [Methanosarcina sp. UBA5]|uniref:glycosyltransferase family 2 protein n=1 Tax=Methanosarcina sp. UBA5 TaxID=1915593 RepID=UPI0025EBFD6D|nr:glycosyltransferase family 2 protein [Methanosarcina sp. UBA5]
MNPKVAIIILNWNGWRDTIECLESIFQIAYPLYQVIIVDNGSKDGSLQKIKEYAQGKIKIKSEFFQFSQENKPIYVKEYFKDEWETSVPIKENMKNPASRKNLILIKNDNNYGFAEGNNIGIRFALNNLNPDYILLLNNDTVVDPNFLNELVNVAESDSHIGILGPTIYEYKKPREIQSAGAKIYWNKGEVINLTPHENKYSDHSENVDSVIGCALLAKSELFYKIGYLNKDYFAYFEETEWCVRARKASYKIVYVPKGKIWHKGGATSNKITGFTLFHHTRNKFWFMKKHSSKKQYFSFLIYFFGFRAWMVIGGILYHQKGREILPSFISFLKGIRDGILT